MIVSNIARTVLGLLLVYAAVLAQPLVLSRGWLWLGCGAAVIVIVLALVSRRLDYHPWHARTALVIGAFLLVMTLVERIITVPSAAVTWIVFWVGLTVAFLALWAALYRPSPNAVEE